MWPQFWSKEWFSISIFYVLPWHGADYCLCLFEMVSKHGEKRVRSLIGLGDIKRPPRASGSPGWSLLHVTRSDGIDGSVAANINIYLVLEKWIFSLQLRLGPTDVLMAVPRNVAIFRYYNTPTNISCYRSSR